MKAYTYNPMVFKSMQGKDWDGWRALFKLIGNAVSFVDRTETIKIPVQTATPDCLRMPEFDPLFSTTYEECCNLRVNELVTLQEKLDVPINLMYSGGIDSSLVLASFIKQIGLTESTKRITILLDQESIIENPDMWDKIIRPNFKILDSIKYGSHLNKNTIVVAGEGNDQLLGSDIYRDLAHWRGPGILDIAWTEADIKAYFDYKGLTPAERDLWFSLYHKLITNATCPIDTIGDWFWYINFACKWGSVYHRMMFCIQDTSEITHEYMNAYYQQFYNTDDFQKWSLINRTHKHQGDYLSYKFHARELITDVLGKDSTYANKVKRNSLFNITKFKYACDLINENYEFKYNINPSDYYEPNNSFI